MTPRVRTCASKGKEEAIRPEPVILSDDEEEEHIPAPAQQSYSQSPLADEEVIPLIPPIAMIPAGQESASPSSRSAQGLLRQLENALKQAGSGEAREASRCLVKLLGFELRLTCLEALLRVDSELDVERLAAEARVRGAWERELQERDLSDKGALVAHLLKRRRLLQTEVDASVSAIAQMKAQLLEEEANMKGLQLESANVHGAVKREMQALQALRQEDFVDVASFEAKIRKEAEDQVQAARAGKIAAIKAELASFNELD